MTKPIQPVTRVGYSSEAILRLSATLRPPSRNGIFATQVQGILGVIPVFEEKLRSPEASIPDKERHACYLVDAVFNLLKINSHNSVETRVLLSLRRVIPQALSNCSQAYKDHATRTFARLEEEIERRHMSPPAALPSFARLTA